MNRDIEVIGFRNGEKIKPSGSFKYQYDGRFLDELQLNNVVLTSNNDFDELIEFLRITQYCFLPSKNKPKENIT